MVSPPRTLRADGLNGVGRKSVALSCRSGDGKRRRMDSLTVARCVPKSLRELLRGLLLLKLCCPPLGLKG